jgi:hypothetical protein
MCRIRLSAALLFLFATSSFAQQHALAPHSMYEPPAGQAAASLTASAKDAPADLLTTGEKTEWRQTGTYSEIIALMRRMEKLSPDVKVIQFGTTSEGRAMYAMVVSSDHAFTPAAAAKTDSELLNTSPSHRQQSGRRETRTDGGVSGKGEER